MTRLVLVVVLSVYAMVFQASAAEVKWLTDLPKAKEQAKKENKFVLLNFTGSDWCPGCIALHKEVFATPQFAEYAEKNLVLVEVDFPKKKKLNEEQQRKNMALQDEYKVPGYPTLVVLNSAGTRLADFTYMPGGPNMFIAVMERIKQHNRTLARHGS